MNKLIKEQLSKVKIAEIGEYSNPVLVSNWNNNTFPKHKYMKVEVIKFIGKMINVNGIGFDYDNNTNTQDTWSGWLPISMIKQIKVL